MTAQTPFSTHLLDAAAAERVAALEAERLGILAKVTAALRAEARRLGLTEAYVVGSLATPGAWTEASDVDVAIAGGDPLVVMMVLEDIAPCTVDVVDLERHPAAELFRRKGMRVLG